MSRKEQLLKIFENVDNKELIERMIDEAVELECKIDYFKTELNNIEINASTTSKYKFFHSCYKDYLTQYVQVIKCLMSFIGKDEDNATSPLREYFNRLQKRND
ncbi:MAG: hypothetical protein SPJ27_04570 [Candidatus Onthovivens sp.]|nr:hypothetical protein [Candidatus Onthovivens sp.]